MPDSEALPAVGTEVQFTRFGQERGGVVVAHLRFPADHAHCPGWVRLLIRAPGLESMVSASECRAVTTVVDAPAPAPVPDLAQPSLF